MAIKILQLYGNKQLINWGNPIQFLTAEYYYLQLPSSETAKPKVSLCSCLPRSDLLFKFLKCTKKKGGGMLYFVFYFILVYRNKDPVLLRTI